MAERRPLVIVNGVHQELPEGDTVPVRNRIWQSGMTVAQGEEVMSPLDWEDYRRVAATGGGIIDPADDVTAYRASSYTRTVQLVQGGAAEIAVTSIADYAKNAVQTSLGAITAGARTLALSVSGRGNIGFFGLVMFGSIALTLEVIVDGRTILTRASGASSRARTFIGAADPVEIALYDANPVEFRRSLAVYITPTSNVGAGSGVAHMIRSTA